MLDKLLDAFKEYRYWRSSVPVGIVIGGLLLTMILNQWPQLSELETTVSPGFYGGADKVPGELWFVLVLVASTQIGSWWCGLAVSCSVWLSRTAICWLPLSVRPESWSKTQRLLGPLIVPLSTVRLMQSEMSRAEDYLDLEKVDRHFAYRNYVRDSIPLSIDASTESALALPTWVDARLSAGLFIPLPLLIWSAKNVVAVQLDGFDFAVILASCVAFVALLTESIVRVRRVADLSLLSNLSQPRLTICARAASGAGRTKVDNEAAENRIA